MAGLPKSIIRKFGMTKRAWSEFRKSKGGGKRKKRATRKRTRARVARRRAVSHSKPTETGASTRGKKRKKMARRARVVARRTARRARRGIKAGMDSRPGKVLMLAGQIAAGGAGTSFLLNKVPKVRDMSQGTKAAGQAVLGLAAIYLGKKKWIKGLGAGAVVAAILSGTKAVLKLDPLAGPGAGMPTLSPEQMRRLVNGGGMSVPASTVRMNVPAAVSMRGGNSPIGGWSSGGWG